MVATKEGSITATPSPQVIKAYTLLREHSLPQSEKTHCVDLSVKNLTSLEQLQALPIQVGNERKCLSALPKLKLLLIKNRLTDISDLITLTNVTDLDLSHNNLLSCSILPFLGALRKLNLAFTGLRCLPNDITALSRLNKLDLSDNALREFPQALLGLVALQKLKLAGNRVQELPHDISRLQEIEYLDLSNTMINLSVENIDRLRTLTTLGVLKLNQNGLTELPSHFGTLTQLRDLYLDHNRLNDLPMSLSNLKSLRGESNIDNKYRTLSLSHNNVTKLPQVIPMIRNLGRLILNHNKLSSLPDELIKGDIPWTLFRLELSSNQFVNLPAILGKLCCLRFLSLNDNKLIEINAFPPNFICLEVRHNKITELPLSLAQYPSSEDLARLDISDNRLGAVVNGVYQPVSSIRDMAMFQNTWWNLTKSFIKGDPRDLQWRLRFWATRQQKNDGKLRANPQLFFLDPIGLLAQLPREILMKVYEYYNPPIMNDDFYFFCEKVVGL